MYTPLTEKTVVDYVRNSPVMSEIFNEDDTLLVDDLADGGNVNLIFRVHAEEAPKARSVLVKQALPHARRYPDFKMPLERARIENDVLAIENERIPGIAPKVYYYDAEMYVNLMEDLNDHLIMRKGMMQQIEYPKFAEDMGMFLARTLFYTSDLYLSSAEKKEAVPRFINPVLCKVTEDLFFTEPVVDNPNNRWTPGLDSLVEEIHANDMLFATMLLMKEKFMTQAQALVHGDFHTGSIMLNPQETRVIDPEFAFYGPIAFDIGSLLGNLIIGYAAQEYHAKDDATRASYRQWILSAVRDTWTTFEAEFRRLWEAEADPVEWGSARFRDHYLRHLLRDAAGFAGAELFRRTIGLAHVDDFTDIPDQEGRAAAERIALRVAHDWLLERESILSIDNLIAMVKR